MTVTVGEQNARVVDTSGRANGLLNGQKILQTPGAQLQMVDGHLAVTLPNVPDGALTTHLAGDGSTTDVDIEFGDRRDRSGDRPAGPAAGIAGRSPPSTSRSG